jgi:hypothetical protein
MCFHPNNPESFLEIETTGEGVFAVMLSQALPPLFPPWARARKPLPLLTNISRVNNIEKTRFGGSFCV